MPAGDPAFWELLKSQKTGGWGEDWSPDDPVPASTPAVKIKPGDPVWENKSTRPISDWERKLVKFGQDLDNSAAYYAGPHLAAFGRKLGEVAKIVLPGSGSVAGAEEGREAGQKAEKGQFGQAAMHAVSGTAMTALDFLPMGKLSLAAVLGFGAATRGKQKVLAEALESMSGLPQKAINIGGEDFTPGPSAAIRDVAEKYMKDAGVVYAPPKTYQPIVVNRAKQISDAFEAMPHAPDDLKVKKSYAALIDETKSQFKAIQDSGLKIEFIKPGMADPYAATPRMAAKDVIDNNHLWVFPTESGFGTGHFPDNPMLQPTGVRVDGRELVANDMFRIVHDYFGHVKEGVGFRAGGEENAFRSHIAMYSDAARPAMATETRGQNSWLNYGPYGEANRTAKSPDTIFAEQKVGLLPKWAYTEGATDPKFPHLAERYPQLAPPELRVDKTSGKEYLGKVQSPEEEALLKQRTVHQAEIDAGRYDPYYDVSKRADVDPANYPTSVDTTRDAVPKKQATINKYKAMAYSDEATKRLEEAYLAGQKLGGSDRWFFVKQLEDDFIKEYGEKEGRAQFKQRFAIPMSSTTAGANPESNFLSAHYGNFLREKGLPYPQAAYEIPSPVGGQRITGNMALHQKFTNAGDIGAENAKRHNFAYDFLGHKMKATIDEQMSDLFKKGMTIPPGDSYGIFEGALAALAKKHGVDPREFQEVAWGGHKAITKGKNAYEPHPFIQTVNESIERTHRLTGMPKEEIVRRGIVRSEIPLYAIGGAAITPAMLAEALDELK